MSIKARALTEYDALFSTVKILPSWVDKIKKALEVIEANKVRYELAASKSSAPWELIAAIHYRESSCNFNGQLFNGEPWNKITTLVPKGLGPWASWEDAAADALKAIPSGSVSSVSRILRTLEAWNGWGYHNHHDCQSPYVWSGSNHGLNVGKYVADGSYDENTVDKQIGAGVLYLLLAKKIELTTPVSIVYQDTGIENVKKLQTFLNDLGATLKVDGVLGPVTAATFHRVFGVQLNGTKLNGNS